MQVTIHSRKFAFMLSAQKLNDLICVYILSLEQPAESWGCRPSLLSGAGFSEARIVNEAFFWIGSLFMQLNRFTNLA